MREFTRKNLILFILAVCSVPLFFIGIADVQSWGDDYAQYLLEAQNIAAGKSYHQTNYLYNDLNTGYAPPAYPPGFPLLMAPVVKLTGISIRPLLNLITTFIVLLLFIHYFIFRKYMADPVAACLALISVYCAAVIEIKGYILSDIPLLLFTSLYILIRQQGEFNKRRIFFLILISVMAVLIRAQGILLILSEILLVVFYFFRSLKQKHFYFKEFIKTPALKIVAGFALLYIVLTQTIFKTPTGFYNFYGALFSFPYDSWWASIASNTSYLFELLFHFLELKSDHQFVQIVSAFIQYGSILFVTIGIITQFKKPGMFAAIFFILMLMMMLLVSAKQGLRYLLPVLPLYLLYFYFGVTYLFSFFQKKAVPSFGIILFTAVFLILGKENYLIIPYQADWTPYTAKDSTAFEYLRKNIDQNEIIVFTKPRALTLYTGKRTMNLAWGRSDEINKKRFDSLNVKYMLTREGLDENYVGNYVRRTRCALDSVQIAGVYTLYRVR